jgi:curved DNA-binding protein CbpA
LRHLLEADSQQAAESLHRTVAEKQATIERLQQELDAARTAVASLQQKEVRGAEETARAIARALDVQRDGQEREKAAQQRWLKEDNQRLKIEASRSMDATMDRHRVYTDNQRQQYEEAKSILMSDKYRLEGECERLQHELTECSTKLAKATGDIEERLKEERVVWEQDLRDSRKEAVRMQAAMRSEALSALDRTKVRGGKRVREGSGRGRMYWTMYW